MRVLVIVEGSVFVGFLTVGGRPLDRALRLLKPEGAIKLFHSIKNEKLHRL